jgi:hypothetical protein
MSYFGVPIIMSGNHVEITGMYVMTINKPTIKIKNGIVPRKTCASGMFEILLITNKLRPTGGDINASSILITSITPK